MSQAISCTPPCTVNEAQPLPPVIAPPQPQVNEGTGSEGFTPSDTSFTVQSTDVGVSADIGVVSQLHVSAAAANTGPVYIAFGPAPFSIAAGAGLAIMPGTTQIINVPSGMTHMAHVMDTGGTGELYITYAA